MNEYKIDVTEVSKKEIIVEAETPNKALDIIQKKYMKPNLKEFKDENLYEIDARIIEENGEIIEQKLDDYEDENDIENGENLDSIDLRLLKIERILNRMERLEKNIDNKMKYVENFAEKAAVVLEDINEEFENTLNLLYEENEEFE